MVAGCGQLCVQRLGRISTKGVASAAPAAKAFTKKRYLSVDQTRQKVETVQQQSRALEMVRTRLGAARDRIKERFNSLVQNATAVISELQSSAQTKTAQLFAAMQSKETACGTGSRNS